MQANQHPAASPAALHAVVDEREKNDRHFTIVDNGRRTVLANLRHNATV